MQANLAALRLVAELAEADRAASADEQAVLARWSGWGAVPQVFDEHLDTYAQARDELRYLLSDREYDAASRTVLNAHYTDGALVEVMWEALSYLGFDRGSVLEPGCGSGHFLGMAPRGAQLVGVERDPTSAAIAGHLYPQARVVAGSYVDLDAAEGSFDAAIGNVPFGGYRLHDPRHNPGRHTIHNHFLLKSLRLVRPGGLVVALTSRYTLDGRNPAARREIAQLADLVGAVRLPSTAHRRAAGTTVVTDLLILRRRDSDALAMPGARFEMARPQQLTDANGDEVTTEINEYFLDHPDHVLGDMRPKFLPARGLDVEVLTDVADADLPAALVDALDPILAEARTNGHTLTPAGAKASPRRATDVGLVDPDAARYAGFLAATADGGFTRRVGDEDQPYTPRSAEQADELRQLLRLRDVAMALLDAENASIDDTPKIHELRAELGAVYDAYVADYGPPSRYEQTRTMLPGVSVFKRWCADHGRDPQPASADTVRDYLTHLRDAGVGADVLTKHRDGIAKDHQRAHGRAVDRMLAQIGLGTSQDVRVLAERVAEADPDGFLATTATADLRLSAAALAAADDVIANAEKTTPDEVDLDELGLRTTSIKRPPQGGFRDDPFAGAVRALEVFDPATGTATKEDVFHRRVINPPPPRLGADTAEEALSICLESHSRIDLDEIARLMGLSDVEAARAELGELVFDDPTTGLTQWAPLYLSGNVRRKLAEARDAADTDPRFAVNVAALERVVPSELGPGDITVQLGSWVPAEYVQQFLRELVDDDEVCVEQPMPSLWAVSTQRGTYAAANEWAGGGLDAYELVERLLLGQEIKVFDEVETTRPDGSIGTRSVLNVENTELARDKAATINDRFAIWVWDQPDRANALLRRYNDLFNSEIPTDYSTATLTLPGYAGPPLRNHQTAAISRMIYGNGTGLIHDVGAGKTLEIIAGVMERSRRGLSTKTVVVVRNDSLAEQFERQWRAAYPQAKILTATSEDFTVKKGVDKRAEFVGRVTTNSWDAILITKDSFQRIPLSADTQTEFIQRELDGIRDLRRQATENASASTIKRIEQVLGAAEDRLKGRLSQVPRDDTGVSFEETGIDLVVVDEAQDFKNGLVTSRLPDQGIVGSNRAIDLDLKLQWLAERHDHSCAVLATATPFTGKIAEVYLFLRRLGHPLPPFDEWARNFIVAEVFTEITPAGTLRPKTRMRRMINEDDLWAMLRLTSDVRMADVLEIPNMPVLRADGVEVITVEASVEARIHSLDLARRERQIRHRGGPPEKGADNHLVVNHHGMQAALDLRTRGIDTDEPQKVDVLADDMVGESRAAADNVYFRPDGTEHPVRGGLILAFCDESIPRREWNFYQELKDQLVARGMPEAAVRFIHDATTDQAKQDLYAACRNGEVSVLLGSTQRMGAGLNVQDRAIGGYEIIPPRDYRADTSHQARGRVVRQLNQNETVFWKRVVLAPSLDAKKWEIVRQKHDLFAPLLSGQRPGRSRDIDDDESIDLADVMTAATGDPRYTEKAELDQEYKSLTRLRQAHQRSQQQARMEASKAEENRPRLRDDVTRAEELAARYQPTRGTQFTMTVDGQRFTERVPAAAALREVLTRHYTAAPRTRDGSDVTVGELGGFTVTARMRPMSPSIRKIELNFAGLTRFDSVELDHANLPDGHRLVTRLENVLAHVPERVGRARAALAANETDLEQARRLIGADFDREHRLAEVAERRRELTMELADPDDEPLVADDDTLDPEARAERARLQEERARRRAEERDALGAAVVAAVSDRAERMPWRFAEWYVAIVDGIATSQHPPVDTAHRVWQDLGRPVPATLTLSGAIAEAEEEATASDEPGGDDVDNQAAQPDVRRRWLAEAAMVSMVPQRWASMDDAVAHLRDAESLPAFHNNPRGARRAHEKLVEEITAARKRHLSPSGALIAYKAAHPDAGRQAWYVVHTASGAQLGELLESRDVDSITASRERSRTAINLPDAMLPRYLYTLDHHSHDGTRVDWSLDFTALRAALADWNETLPVDSTGALRATELPTEVIGARTLHGQAVLAATTPDPLAAALYADSKPLGATRNTVNGELARLAAWVWPARDATVHGQPIGPLHDALRAALSDCYDDVEDDDRDLEGISEDTSRALIVASVWGFGGDPDRARHALEQRADDLAANPTPGAIDADTLRALGERITTLGAAAPTPPEPAPSSDLHSTNAAAMPTEPAPDPTDNVDNTAAAADTAVAATDTDATAEGTADDGAVRDRPSPDVAEDAVPIPAAEPAPPAAADGAVATEPAAGGAQPRHDVDDAPNTVEGTAEGPDVPVWARGFQLSGPQAAWLQRQLVAIAHHGAVRSAALAATTLTPPLIVDLLRPAFLRPDHYGSWDRNGYTEQAGLEVARRYGEDPEFAERITIAAADQVHVMVRRDAAARLAQRIQNLTADLGLVPTADDEIWVRQWITDLAADRHLRLTAEANSEDQIEGLFREAALDAAVVAVDNHDVPDSVGRWLFGPAQNYWADLARAVIYDMVNQRGDVTADDPLRATTELTANDGAESDATEPDATEAEVGPETVAGRDLPTEATGATGTDKQVQPAAGTLSLTGLRELAAEHDLAVRLVRVGDRAFVAVHEPLVPNPSVLVWPEGGAVAYEGAARPVPDTQVAKYLAAYRRRVEPQWFTGNDGVRGVRDWSRRLAGVTPHIVAGPGYLREADRLVYKAQDLLGLSPRMAEDALGSVEEMVPFAPTPDRRAQLVREIEDHASGYARLGDVGRYLTEPGHLDGTRREWDWINAYVDAHPEVTRGHPDHAGIRERNQAEQTEQRARADELVREANTAKNTGDFDRAMHLLDAAELAWPGTEWKWQRLRTALTEARAKAESAAPSGEDGTVAEPVVDTGPVPTSASGASAEPSEQPSSADTADHQGTAAGRQPPLTAADSDAALLARVNAAAAQWFTAQLDSTPTATTYLADRLGGADRVATARQWMTFGYAPRGWTGLVEHLRGLGFADSALVDAGVAQVSRRGELIDRFRDRLMVAIRDTDERIAGFIGRAAADGGDDTPKYLNTPATPLFHKQNLLLGFTEQRGLVDQATVVVVEGPLDVAALIAADDPERRRLLPVAPCGTALTDGHLTAIDAAMPVQRRRVWALDGDDPGQEAMMKRVERYLDRYRDFDVTLLPDGHDQASYALTVTPAELIAAHLEQPHTRPALDRAVDARLGLWSERLDSVDGTVNAARDVAALLATVDADRASEQALRVLETLDISAEYMAEFIAEARPVDQIPTGPPTQHADAEPAREDGATPDEDGATAGLDETSAAEPPAAPGGAPAGDDQDPPRDTDNGADASDGPDTTTDEHGPNDHTASDGMASPALGTGTGEHDSDEPATDTDQAGYWASRIHIELDGRTALVTGTSQDDPHEIRAALLDNGFKWRPREGYVWKHVRARGKPDRDTAVANLRDTLAELDARETDVREAEARSPGARAPQHPPTAQQQAIIDACLSGRDVAVRALAGTGKTSTMRMVAARMPNTPITYIAFNRSIADEAQEAFGRGGNVRADTMHAFARQALMNNPRYQKKLRTIARRDGYPEQLARDLGWDPDEFVSYGEGEDDCLTNSELVKAAVDGVKRFRESADTELRAKHLGREFEHAHPGMIELIVNCARKVWEDKTSPDGTLPFTHDDYLKIWALGNPTIPGDAIIFDEAQDVNELQARLVQAQRAQTIVVGDSYQSIYGFRGARDFLRDWPAEVVLPLTKSWRFGPAVAAAGNRFLTLLSSRLELEGNPDRPSELGTVTAPDAVLCRTNASAVGAVLTALEEDIAVALVGGGDEITKIAKAAQNLQHGYPANHEDLRGFASWKEVREAAEHDQALQTLVRLVDQHKPEGLLAMAQRLVDEDATGQRAPELVVSTAHKAKGREWDSVRIAEDFKSPTWDPETDETVLPTPEELRLSYVTVTRAQKRLDLGSLAWILDDAYTVDTAEDRAAAVPHQTASEAPTPATAEAPTATEDAPAAEHVDAAEGRSHGDGVPSKRDTAPGADGVSTGSERWDRPAAAPPQDSAEDTTASGPGDDEPRDADVGLAVTADEIADRATLSEALRQRRRATEGDSAMSPATTLALAIAANAVSTGARFTPAASARRVAGNADAPEDTAVRLRELADHLHQTAVGAGQSPEALGRYHDGRSLTEHLQAIAAAIDEIVADPVALGRARAAGLFDTISGEELLRAHRDTRAGDNTTMDRLLGPTSRGGRLLDLAALGVLRDAIVASTTRTRFDGPSRGRRENTAGQGKATAIAVQALAAEGRVRATGADQLGSVLQETGMAAIADRLDAVAGNMAAAGGYALPDDPGSHADGVDGTPETRPDSPPVLALTDVDIACALRHLAPWQFIATVAGRDRQGELFGTGGWGINRREGEPDAGASEDVNYTPAAMTIEVRTPEETRTGRLTRARLLRWVEQGITPPARQILQDALAAGTRFQLHEPGFTVREEVSWADEARRELHDYADEAQRRIVDAALQNAQRGTPSPRRRRRASTGDEALIAVDAVTAAGTEDRAVLERIAALREVVAANYTTPVPISELAVGDSVVHHGHVGHAFRLTAPPVFGDTSIVLIGKLLPPTRSGEDEMDWRIATDEIADPRLHRIVVPESLSGLMPAPERAAAVDTAKTDTVVDGQPHELAVPETLDLNDYGWIRTGLRSTPSGPVEQWRRDDTDLTLPWQPTEEGDLLLGLPLLLDNEPHGVDSLAELEVLLAEAGRYGYAARNGTRWNVLATPTRGDAHAIVARGSDLHLAHREGDGWVFTITGSPVPVGDTAPAATATATTPPPPSQEAEQFSLLDLPGTGASTTTAPPPTSAADDAAHDNAHDNADPTAAGAEDVDAAVEASEEGRDVGEEASDDDPDAELHQIYEDEGITFVGDTADVPALLEQTGWVCRDTQLLEVGGLVGQHWERHETSLGISFDQVDGVTSEIFYQFDTDPDGLWRDTEIGDAHYLQTVITEAGRYGVARPGRVPGQWRVTPTLTAQEARLAVESAEGDEPLVAVRDLDAHEHSVWFVEGEPRVPLVLAADLPTIRHDRQGVLDYVAGEQHGDPALADAVAVVVTGRKRRGVTEQTALAALSIHDPELVRRAATARAGKPRGRGKFDVDAAIRALERLAEGDPSLPLASVGHHVTIPAANDSNTGDGEVEGIVRDARAIVDGVQLEIAAGPATGDARDAGTTTVVVAPDTTLTVAAPQPAEGDSGPAQPAPEPTAQPTPSTNEPDDAARPERAASEATQDVPEPSRDTADTADASGMDDVGMNDVGMNDVGEQTQEPGYDDLDAVPEIDTAQTAADRADELAALWADEADGGHGPDSETEADTEADTEAAPAAPVNGVDNEPIGPQRRPRSDAVRAAPELPAAVNPLAEQWSALLAQAAALRYTVVTTAAAASELDTTHRTIRVSDDQPPHQRVVDLALKLVDAAAADHRLSAPEPAPPPAAAPAEAFEPFPRQRGELDLAAPPQPRADDPDLGRGRFSGELTLPAAAQTGPEPSTAGFAHATPIYDSIARELDTPASRRSVPRSQGRAGHRQKRERANLPGSPERGSYRPYVPPNPGGHSTGRGAQR